METGSWGHARHLDLGIGILMWAISKGGMTTKLLERDKTTFGKDRDRWNQPLLGLLSFYVQLSSRAGLLSLNDLPYLLPLTSTSSCFRGASTARAGAASSSYVRSASEPKCKAWDLAFSRKKPGDSTSPKRQTADGQPMAFLHVHVHVVVASQTPMP